MLCSLFYLVRKLGLSIPKKCDGLEQSTFSDILALLGGHIFRDVNIDGLRFQSNSFRVKSVQNGIFKK